MTAWRSIELHYMNLLNCSNHSEVYLNVIIIGLILIPNMKLLWDEIILATKSKWSIVSQGIPINIDNFF